MGKALITGASSGIGRELAFVMSEKGHDLVLVSRNLSDLEKVQKQIQSKTRVNVLIKSADLSVPGSATSLYNELKGQKINILINNAGVGLRGDFFHDDPDRTFRIAHLNMITVMELSQLFGKEFIKNNEGKILNIGSIASFVPGPKQPVYYSSKAFVRNLSRALAYNLRNTNVTVTMLHPGITKTKFFESSNADDITSGASARAVAVAGYNAMMSGKTELTYGLLNKLLTSFVFRIIPYKYQARLIDKASKA